MSRGAARPRGFALPGIRLLRTYLIDGSLRQRAASAGLVVDITVRPMQEADFPACVTLLKGWLAYSDQLLGHTQGQILEPVNGRVMNFIFRAAFSSVSFRGARARAR